MAVKMAGSQGCGSPPYKLLKEEPPDARSGEAGSVTVKVEVDWDESREAEVGPEEPFLPPSPSPQQEPKAPQLEGHINTNSALHQVTEAMKDFLQVDTGSLASAIMDNNTQELERLSLQTSKMKGLFARFPESLLLHQLSRERGHVLYAFLVESKDRVGKLIHLAILKEDTQEKVQEMLSVFKKFNPEWRKVKVVFVDLGFLHRSLLQQVFPSAQVLLSVYHTMRLLEKKLKASRVPFSVKRDLKLALKEAVFSTSSSNLKALSQLVGQLGDKELYEALEANWFSCEMLWYMHAKKGLHYCSTYIDSLDLITGKLSSLLSMQLRLETSILRLVEHADSFNTNGPPNLSQGLSGQEQKSRNGTMKNSKQQTSGSAKRGPMAPVRTVAEPCLKGNPAKPAATMLTALQETCTDEAYLLCLNEWDVVQKSAQLFGSTKNNKITVQLLEDTHQVYDVQQVHNNSKWCSCYFYCRYHLPCRHILSMLRADQQVVEKGMVSIRWQKKCPVLQENLHDPSQDSTGIQGSTAATTTRERWEKVQSLCKELGNLLLQSEGDVLEERLSTLKMIASMWDNCCELKEEEEEEGAVKPLLWVKKEEVEESTGLTLLTPVLAKTKPCLH